MHIWETTWEFTFFWHQNKCIFQSCFIMKPPHRNSGLFSSQLCKLRIRGPWLVSQWSGPLHGQQHVGEVAQDRPCSWRGRTPWGSMLARLYPLAHKTSNVHPCSSFPRRVSTRPHLWRPHYLSTLFYWEPDINMRVPFVLIVCFVFQKGDVAE